MILTRKSLKNLIAETLREQNSILLEMPEEPAFPVNSAGKEGEGNMAKKDLFHLSQKSSQLHDMLADDEDLEEWVQAKITKSAGMMSSVFDHLMYQKHPGHIKE
jgi:hypothetical protein